MEPVKRGRLCPHCSTYNARNISADILLIDKSQGKILLTKRNIPPGIGKWCLPGGHLDWDENLEECAKRELFEETGYKAEKIDFFKLFSDPKRDERQVVSAAFVCFKFKKAGNFDPDEVQEICWFKTHDLPDMGFDHKRMIKEYFEHG